MKIYLDFCVNRNFLYNSQIWVKSIAISMVLVVINVSYVDMRKISAICLLPPNFLSRTFTGKKYQNNLHLESLLLSLLSAGAA